MYTRTSACVDDRHHPQRLFDLKSDPREDREQRSRQSPSSQDPPEEVRRFMRSLQYLR